MLRIEIHTDGASDRLVDIAFDEVKPIEVDVSNVNALKIVMKYQTHRGDSCSFDGSITGVVHGLRLKAQPSCPPREVPSPSTTRGLRRARTAREGPDPHGRGRCRSGEGFGWATIITYLTGLVQRRPSPGDDGRRTYRPCLDLRGVEASFEEPHRTEVFYTGTATVDRRARYGEFTRRGHTVDSDRVRVVSGTRDASAACWAETMAPEDELTASVRALGSTALPIGR